MNTHPIINAMALEAIVSKAETESTRLSKLINYATHLRQKHERQRAQALAVLEFVKGETL